MNELPASCTVGDWLRRMGENGRGLWGLGQVNNHVVGEVLRRDNRTEYTLDNDATIIDAEKAEAMWTYQKEPGYQPLLGFLFELGLILRDEFRDGNVPAEARAVEFLDLSVQMMPKGKKIRYYRSDSAACQAGVINYCFGHDMLFTITADKDEGVMEVISSIKSEEWEPYEKDRETAESVHTINKTKEAFRLIVQRWPKLQGELFNPDPYCYHAIATNREEPAKEIARLHNQRGQVENFIKELKYGFGMDWMPCGETYTNAVFFRIVVIAYNLFQALKLLGLPVWWCTATIATVRWKLYQVAAKVVYYARQVLVKLATSVDKINLFRQVCHRCVQMDFG